MLDNGNGKKEGRLEFLLKIGQKGNWHSKEYRQIKIEVTLKPL